MDAGDLVNLSQTPIGYSIIASCATVIINQLWQILSSVVRSQREEVKELTKAVSALTLALKSLENKIQMHEKETGSQIQGLGERVRDLELRRSSI